jgi:hypothetical protein
MKSGFLRAGALSSLILSVSFAAPAAPPLPETTAATLPTSPSAAPITPTSPWGFNLSAYTWLAGATGNYNVGPSSRSIDASFLDINSKSRRFPVGFMGRAEAHYDRVGFFLDGNYVDLALKPRFSPVSNGLDSALGLMDYGLTYRLFGPTAAEIPGWHGKKRPNRLDLYAGARTLWLDNSITVAGPLGLSERQFSSSQSFTSPILGGRFLVDFNPEIFMMVDGNVGGFGAQNVNFTGAVLGMVGYRLSAFDVPISVELGYKALKYNVDKGGPASTNALLNGPFIGFSGYW